MLNFSLPTFLAQEYPLSALERHRQAEDFEAFLSTDAAGFFSAQTIADQVSSCQKIFERFRHKKRFYHIGIGGSSLGPEMLHQALRKTPARTQFTFINNIDPDELSDQLFPLRQADALTTLEECLFYVVSKSGGTAETMAALSIIVDIFKRLGIPSSKWREYIVVATDANSGDLLNFARDYGLSSLEVPGNIGGRFSVLTSVGLLPCLFLEQSLRPIPQIFAQARQALLSGPVKQSFYEIGHILTELKSRAGVNQTVLMPYSSKLQKFSSWFVQLWAESLGKKHNQYGEEVFTGLTPIAAFGATDQHAQMQLFREGPRDKFIFFVEVGKFQHDFSLSNDFTYPALKKLAKASLSQLMRAELKGTLRAMEESRLPHALITLPQLDLESLVHLTLFFETLTVYIGKNFKIDPFNQPGVEAAKKYAFEYLQSAPK